MSIMKYAKDDTKEIPVGKTEHISVVHLLDEKIATIKEEKALESLLNKRKKLKQEVQAKLEQERQAKLTEELIQSKKEEVTDKDRAEIESVLLDMNIAQRKDIDSLEVRIQELETELAKRDEV